MGTKKEEKKMTREEFYEFALKEVPNYLDDKAKADPEYDLRLMECNKTNTKYQGLCAFKRNGVPVPVANLDKFYDEYEDCECLVDILQHIADTLVIPAPSFVPDNSFDIITDYEKIKDKLYIVAVRRESCYSDLSFEYAGVDDIVLVAKVLFGKDDNGISTCKVDKALLSAWDGIDEEDVYAQALENTVKIFDTKVVPITEMLPIPPSEADDMPFVPLIVSNDACSCGAGLMFCGDTMKKVSDKIGGDFYAIPSSINEWICLPVEGVNHDEELLKIMIKQTNETCVRDEEVLSDSLFRYFAEEDKFVEVV